ncbi:hypothetical protein BJX70DRAFT_357306 [Aspergillus crustosus]
MLIFRQQEAQRSDRPPSLLVSSIARKCTLPARTVAHGTGIIPPDGKPIEVSERELQNHALRAFSMIIVLCPSTRLSRSAF